MNTDRELLELAAKAAGIKIYAWRDGSLTAIVTGADGPLWNPLTDDGDALRLAVKLRLIWDELELFDVHFDGDEPDIYVATRRAIVRAAAEIGRSMQ